MPDLKKVSACSKSKYLNQNERENKSGNLVSELNPLQESTLIVTAYPEDSLAAFEDENLTNSEKLDLENSFSTETAEWYLAETKKAASIIEAAVKYTPEQIEIDNDIFYNKDIQDKLVQAGLVEVSSSFFPFSATINGSKETLDFKGTSVLGAKISSLLSCTF